MADLVSTLQRVLNDQSRRTGSKKKSRNKGRKNNAGAMDISYCATPVAPPSADGVVIQRSPRPPRITQTIRGTRIVHSEQLFRVSSTAALNVISTPVMPTVFPWLAGVALNFSRWRWHKLRLTYIPACPTSSVGQVAMAWDYDFTDATPSSIQQVQTMYRSVTGPVWAGWEGSAALTTFGRIAPGAISQDLDVSRLGTQRNDFWPTITTSGFTALTSAEKTQYCPAQHFFATQDGTDGVLVGNLYATYDVELVEPIPQDLN